MKTKIILTNLKYLKWLTALLLFAMMVLTFIDVIGRYLLSAPVYGAAEMIQFLLAGVIFSALPLVSHENSHVSVELFSPKIASYIPNLHSLVVHIFSIIGLLIIGIEMARLAIHALGTGRETIVLEWPISPLLIFIACMCMVAAIVQANYLREELTSD